MKKIMTLFMCMAFVVGFAMISQADQTSVSTVGTTFTIPDSGGGSGVTFVPSPNIQVGWNSATSEFAINSQNDVTTTANGLEYGIGSDNPGYFQRTKAVDAGTAISSPGATDSAAFNGWTAMGGGS